MKNKEYTHLREQVQKIEEKILAIMGRNVDFNMERTRLQRKYEQVEKLIWKRKHLLDKMFVAKTEEVKRMEQLNNRLLDLTQKMLSRTEALYRNLMTVTYDPEFDDDVEVEGSLRFSLNGQSSVLPMANDDYYGSNFYEIFCVVDWLYTCNYLGTEEIECINISLADYSTEMSSEELGFNDDLNDGSSWYMPSMPSADKLNHLCICHAIHALSYHKPYSIPDILRMNDFCVEVKVKHQQWEEQDGCGWKWWERCSFEKFRDKFVREAEQNRAPQIRLGQEIANRTRLYFYDYLEGISADIPGVESWKEPFSDEVRYRWRPQKDCFYLDKNIDDYLRELYEFVRR